ncbi:MAG: hypothetical protein Q7J45_01065 [bacterium]|nr:hypothetical protein [bacterium]
MSENDNAVLVDREKMAKALAITEYIALTHSSGAPSRTILVTLAKDDNDARQQAQNGCRPWENVVKLYKLQEVSLP